MGIPPESKNKSLDIIKDIIKAILTLMLAGILIPVGIGALFFFLQMLTWSTGNKQDREVKQNIAMVNRLQISRIISERDGIFAKTFDELAIGVLHGDSTADSPAFQYKINTQSKDLAIIGAKPIDKEKNGFNGAVLSYKNKKGFSATKSIMCQSAVAGVDGTEQTNLPVVNAMGKLSCASNWKILEENNRGQSDLDLAESIQNKAKDEIHRVLREQNSIYDRQGKFVSRYKDISKEKNNPDPKFNVKIRSQEDRAIVTIRHTPSEQAKYKTSFGLIKIVRSKQAQPLSDSSQEKNKILWHYLDMVSFLCTSDRAGVILPKNRELDRIVDRCPTGYTKSSVIEHEYNLAKDNLVTIRMTQEAYYLRHHKFMTNFAELEKFTIETSRSYSSFIKVKQDPYQYNFRVNGKVLVMTAQPKSFTNPLSTITYLRISSATGADKDWPYVHTFCESKIPNIVISTDEEINKIASIKTHDTRYRGEGCPTGYYILKSGSF